MKVKAINWPSVIDSEIGRTRNINEVWEVSKDRYNALSNYPGIELEVVEEVKKATAPKKATKRSV